MKVQKDYLPVLRINAPEWYRDPCFVSWLEGRHEGTASIATWHKGNVGEYSDVFCTFSDGDGSNSDMPEHIWEQICQIVEDQYGSVFVELLLWISNLEEPTEEECPS